MELDDLNDDAYSDCLEQVKKAGMLVLWRVSENKFYTKTSSLQGLLKGL
jgi:hypothetical protein